MTRNNEEDIAELQHTDMYQEWNNKTVKHGNVIALSVIMKIAP